MMALTLSVPVSGLVHALGPDGHDAVGLGEQVVEGLEDFGVDAANGGGGVDQVAQVNGGGGPGVASVGR